MPEVTLSVVLIEHEDAWSAQCLEYDIGAQAATLNDVIYEFQRSIVGHVAICAALEREPFKSLKAAPQKYWKMWEQSKALLSTEMAPFRAPQSAPTAPTFKIAA